MAPDKSDNPSQNKPAPSGLKISLAIVSNTDITRLQRELNRLDDYFVGAAARAEGAAQTPPHITRVLNELATANRVNLLEAAQRKKLNEELGALLKRAPLFHISFAAEPSPKGLEQILAWLRQNIHPEILLLVGLQPTIAAGCVLRTPNKLFDMSLSAYLKRQQPFLTKLIEGAAGV